MPKLMKQTNKSISRLYLQLSKSFSQERNVCFKSENKNGYYFIEGNPFHTFRMFISTKKGHVFALCKPDAHNKVHCPL